jgi:hypothetical protein
MRLEAQMSKLCLSLLAGGCLAAATAASPSIGIVKSTGSFRVDGAAIRGNGTVFEGNVIETGAARSTVQIGAAQLTLLPHSRARIWRERVALEKGSGLLARPDGRFVALVESANLSIEPAKDSVTHIAVAGPGRVAVASRDGGVAVRNSGGMLLASLRSGMGVAFAPDGSASTAVKVAGVLRSLNGKYLLTDQTTNVTFELTGSGLASYVGKYVEVEGSVIPGANPAPGASQTVQVAKIDPQRQSQQPVAGLSGTAKAAIIGGVSAAGTVIGLVSAGSFSSHTPTSVP